MNIYAVVLVRVVWLFFYMSCACSLERIQSGAALYAFMLSKWPPIPCVVEKEDLTLVHLATTTCYIFQICSCVLSKTTAHKVLKIIVAPKWLDLPNGVTMCYYYFFFEDSATLLFCALLVSPLKKKGIFLSKVIIPSPKSFVVSITSSYSRFFFQNLMILIPPTVRASISKRSSFSFQQSIQGCDFV